MTEQKIEKPKKVNATTIQVTISNNGNTETMKVGKTALSNMKKNNPELYELVKPEYDRLLSKKPSKKKPQKKQSKKPDVEPLTTIKMVKDKFADLKVDFVPDNAGNIKVVGKRVILYIKQGKKSVVGWNQVENCTLQCHDTKELNHLYHIVQENQKEA